MRCFERLCIAAVAAAGLMAAGAGEATAQPPPATASEAIVERLLERALEEAGAPQRSAPPPLLEAAGVVARVAPAQLLAGARQTITVSAAAPGPGTLRVTLPALFTRTAASGLRFAGTPRRLAGGALRRRGRVVRLRALDGRAGLAIRDLGLPARPYVLRLAWERAGRPPLRLGNARIGVYAPPLDTTDRGDGRWRGLPVGSFLPADATGDQADQNESFVAVSPDDPARIVVGYNHLVFEERGRLFSLSTDGGATFGALTMPEQFDVAGRSDPMPGRVCCDPMLAAATGGQIWLGGLAGIGEGDQATSAIVVNRLDSAGGLRPLTVALPQLTGFEDKPMLAIDDAAGSPTHGRLYAVWSSIGGSGLLDGGVTIALSYCDTRPGGVELVARCDEADSWSPPLALTEQGSHQIADAAVGPDGTVYVVYWDFSAENAVRGVVCRATPRTACGGPGSFSAPANVAVLDATLGQFGVPFACPTHAAPGGRIHPVPSVDVDVSGGPDHGRVWVAWTDLRADSGATTCNPLLQPGPLPAQRTWDPYVASAVGTLPSGPDASAPSAQVGTRVSSDAGTGAAGTDPDNADDFHPWLAVDQTTGQAWVDWYSTLGDARRETAHFYIAPLAAGTGTAPTVGPATRVSETAADYSDAQCCGLGNDYGDYTGLAAARGVVVPVWTSRSGAGDDGDVLVAVHGTPVPARAAEGGGPEAGGASPAAAGLSASLRVRRVGLQRALRAGIPIAVRCSQACRATLRAVRLGRGGSVVGALRLELAGAGVARGRLAIRAAARRRLRQARAVRLHVRGRAVGARGAVRLGARVRLGRRTARS